MDLELLYIILGIAIGLFIGFLVAKLFYQTRVRSHRKAAVKQSKATTLGYVNEKIAPLLPEFPYEFKDLTYVGKGIDYLVFDGLSYGNLEEIVLLEIKSGKSRLNKNERQIKQAVKDGNIRYELMRINL